MHEKRYSAEIERLRSPERLNRLEVQRVVGLCLDAELVQSVLDIGTGSGMFAEAFAEQVHSVVGIDVNPEMVKVSQKLVPKASFREAKAEAIPFDDRSFDLVFMGLVLHEVDDLQKTLSEAYRCARKRVVALEWPYEQQEFGPPLEHRLKQEDVVAVAHGVGFKAIAVTALRELLLYQMTV